MAHNSLISQFEISFSAVMFSMFINIESLYFITKFFWNIGVSTNLPLNIHAYHSFCHYLSRNLSEDLTNCLKSPGVFFSSLKCFLKPSPLLDRIFCFKLFLKYRSAITSHLKQLELTFFFIVSSRVSSLSLLEEKKNPFSPPPSP